MSKTIAIIGAGASGLAAIKSCLDEGLTPVCFERSGNIGGLWRYTDDVTEGQGCVMRSTIANTSKETMCFSDFPMPDDFPVYMHNSKVLEYLELYADRFALRKHIRHCTDVTDVRECPDGEGWEVCATDRTTGRQERGVYHGVMVCNGHHTRPYSPDLPGLREFRGQVIHGHAYRRPDGYQDRRVLVVGIGNSAGDIATELSRVCKQVYVSTRRGTWILPRVFDHGYPSDMTLVRRVTFLLQRILPVWLINSVLERQLNRRFNHANYGLQPTFRATEQQPTVNDDLPSRILNGCILVKPDIIEIRESSIEFDDGTVICDVDAIILATGYTYGFPFVGHPALTVKDNQVDLYKFVFPPDIRSTSLAVIGCVQATGPILPLSEIQSRWAARVFKGVAHLPSQEEMYRDIRHRRLEISRRLVKCSRWSFRAENIPFMDEIAELIGCKPNIGAMLLRDPVLAARCFLGPFSPYQYRLVGPGRWKGATEAIRTVWNRTLTPTRTRTVRVKSGAISGFSTMFALLALCAMAVALGYSWLR